MNSMWLSLFYTPWDFTDEALVRKMASFTRNQKTGMVYSMTEFLRREMEEYGFYAMGVKY